MMHPSHTIVAMAGLGEAAEFFALMLAWGSLIVIGITTLVACARRSRMTIRVAGILTFITSVFFMPWRAFVPLTPSEAQDPDVRSWMDSERVFAVAWGLLVIFVLVSLIALRRREPKPAVTGQATTDGHERI